MTMAHSVEGRSPLLDQELVELCATIPSSLKIDHTGMKVIFREAMGDLFPKGFFDRPKMGFSVPVAEWIRGELRTECYRSICGDALMGRNWFNEKAVRMALDEHMAGKADWSAHIWNLLMLAEWVKLYT